jgi:peptide/nickel transport system substrate-binding protein
MIAKIHVEADAVTRNAMIRQALTVVRNDFAFLPIHDQPLSWGARKGVEVQQRADGVLNIRDIVMP